MYPFDADTAKREFVERLRQAEHEHLVEWVLANRPKRQNRLLAKLGDLLITLRASLKTQPQQEFV